MNANAKNLTPPHYDRVGHASKPSAKKHRQDIALIISQGISCGKLRNMAKTGIDACFPQQFVLRAYEYKANGERIDYTNGMGCLVWIKIRSLGLLSSGVYVHGEIHKAHVTGARTYDATFGGFAARHRNHPAVKMLRPGTIIQFVHRGAMAEGAIFELSDPKSQERYLPYIPEHLECSDEDRFSLLTSMVPLSAFTAKTASTPR